MRILAAVTLLALIGLPSCPLNCEQQLLVVQDKERHAIEVCAAGAGAACDEAATLATIARQAWDQKYPNGCAPPPPPTPTPGTTVPTPPPPPPALCVIDFGTLELAEGGPATAELDDAVKAAGGSA